MIPPIWVEVFRFLVYWRAEGWKNEQSMKDRERALNNHFFHYTRCVTCGGRSA